jgi:hypothetical protein
VTFERKGKGRKRICVYPPVAAVAVDAPVAVAA